MASVAYVLTTKARRDLDDILSWIEGEMRNPQGAEVVENYLFDSFERIGRDPTKCGGHSRTDLTAKPVKFLTIRKYVIIYDDRTDPVRILAVAGGRQNLARLLARDSRYSDLSDG